MVHGKVLHIFMCLSILFFGFILIRSPTMNSMHVCKLKKIYFDANLHSGSSEILTSLSQAFPLTYKEFFLVGH